MGEMGEANKHEGGASRSTTDSHDRTYEIMNMSPHRYLCEIPVLQPPKPENETETELAKAAEAKEFDRAAASGWELISQLEDSCLYFGSGWWSYSFCQNREITQYHALPSVPNGQPPKRDPATAKYTLGRVPAMPQAAYSGKREEKNSDEPVSSEKQPVPAELAIKGDQRYLVQRLEGGTICDLTGRERTVEVQYHCSPDLKTDRIGWIKEVTICSYLMVINTPRLCSDIAFLPPQGARANPINCQLIYDGVDGGQPPPQIGHGAQAEQEPAEAEQQAQSTDSADLKDNQVTIGGIVVGARHVLSQGDEEGKPPVKLAQPRAYLQGSKNAQQPQQQQAQQNQQQGKEGETSDGGGVVQQIIDKLADALDAALDEQDEPSEVVSEGKSKQEGGKVYTMGREDLEDLDLDPDVVYEMRDKMIAMAGELGWKLEVVEANGGEYRELRGYIDEDPAALANGSSDKKGKKGKNDKQKDKKKKDDGSEEKFFKDGR